MSEPRARLWNKDNSDVLPEFQLTYGHALFRGLPVEGWRSKLFRSLELGKPSYSGPLQPALIPRHPRKQCPVLGSTREAHLVFARLRDVWAVFGPHDLFFSSAKWINFNAKLGGLIAFGNQLDEGGSFFFYVFQNGLKQTNAVVDAGGVRIIPDTPIAAYIDGEKIFEDRPTCALSEAEVRDLIAHDLTIRVAGGQVSIGPRFSESTALVEDVMHFIFQRDCRPKSFVGVRFG